MTISLFSSFLKKNRYKILLLVIILLAAFLRFYRLDVLPNGLNQDEAVNGYDAYSLAYTMRDHHGEFLPIALQSFGDWVSPALTYLTIPFIRVFGLSVFAVRLPVALLGVIAVFLCYIFILQLTMKKDLALLGAFIFSIIPWHITLSRWAIPPSIVPFFLLLSVASFYWAKSDNSKYGYYKLTIFILSATFLTYSYPTEKLFAPILVFALCTIFFFKKLKQNLFVVISYILLIAPQYLLIYIDPKKYNARFNNVSIFGKCSSYHQILYQFFSRYREYILPDFNFGAGDSNGMQHIQGVPSSYPFLALFFYIGIAFSIYVVLRSLANRKTFKSQFLSWQDHLFLLLWFFVAPLPASITLDFNHTLRVVHYLTLVIIYCAIGASVFLTYFKKQIVKYALYTAIVLLSLSVLWMFGNIYFVEYIHSSKSLYQYGVQATIDYALSKQNQCSHIYVDTRMNEPYIFYLFYSKYDPSKINYDQLNVNYVPGAYFEPANIGKFYLVRVSIDSTKATLVDKVADQDGVWYLIYAYKTNLYLQRVT